MSFGGTNNTSGTTSDDYFAIFATTFDTRFYFHKCLDILT